MLPANSTRSTHSAAFAAPTQRRRRPALACLQCRRRKVKCDQKKPCTQCLKSKDLVCSYPSVFEKTPLDNRNHNRQGRAASQSHRHELDSEFQIPTPDSSTAAVSTTHSPLSSNPCTLSQNPEENYSRFPHHATIEGLLTVVDGPPQTPGKPISSYQPDIERHVPAEDCMPDLDLSLRPCPIKSKLFGESHWMNHSLQMEKLCSHMFFSKRAAARGEPSELQTLLHQCKLLGRTIKSSRPHGLSTPDYKASIPSREICDQLVANYFRTFESMHRILHVPSFMADYDEYWANPEREDNNVCPFVMKFLLVMAIGTTFYTSSPSESESVNTNEKTLRSAARQWIYVAQQWISAPLEKSRMNISGLQIQCLLLVARETVGVGSDLIWASAGTLLRTAMQLGYHRDPKRFPGMSILHAEMRRRLWASILDMNIQASYTAAMPPLISLDDFDTELPANINDSEISKTTKKMPASKPLTCMTQTTLQILLMQSVKTRLEILRRTTSLIPISNYEEVLKLNSEMTTFIRHAIHQPPMTNSSASQPLNTPTPFHKIYLSLLLQRPLLSLHRPWAILARTDPRYYFSRKVSLDVALAISPLSPSYSSSSSTTSPISTPDTIQGLDADHKCLLTLGHGIWREDSPLPALTLLLELVWQLEECSCPDPTSTISPSISNHNHNHNLNLTLDPSRAKADRAPLIAVSRSAVALQRERIVHGENNIKGYLFIAVALAQVEATERGGGEVEVEEAIGRTAVSCLRECLEILRGRLWAGGAGKGDGVEGTEGAGVGAVATITAAATAQDGSVGNMTGNRTGNGVIATAALAENDLQTSIPSTSAGIGIGVSGGGWSVDLTAPQDANYDFLREEWDLEMGFEVPDTEMDVFGEWDDGSWV